MSGASGQYIGRGTPRIEDPKLLRGAGGFVDDLRLPGLLSACFVRSPYAHAAIGAIETAEARAMPGVVAVLTGEDIAARTGTLRLPLAFPPGKLDDAAMPMILATREVTFVGEAVALVIAESRYVAEDAAELVEVDYDPLDCVVDPRDAAAPGSALARTDTESNRFVTIDVEFGDCEAAFAGAAHVIGETFSQHRGVAHPIEPRGILV